MRETDETQETLQSIIDAVETGLDISSSDAEIFSDFVYDGGRRYAVEAVRALCKEAGYLEHTSDEVVSSIIDWYITELVRPLTERDNGHDTYEAFNKRGGTLLPFLNRVKKNYMNNGKKDRESSEPAYS